MIIQSKKIWVSGCFIEGQIEIEGNKIKAIYKYDEKKADKDYGDNWIVPGFIDVHCHGGIAFDTNDAVPQGLKDWAKHLLQEGITSFCPTTVTHSKETLTNALKNVAAVKKEGYDGAEIIGVHFEGPYLNVKNKGAQPEEYIVKASVEEFKEYQKAADGLIKIVTMACELDPNFELTQYLRSQNVNVSLGHTAATYNEALLSVANGANCITHTFNGMLPMHHREPGVPGAAMNLKNTYAEIICDGNHVNFPVVRALVNAKGPDWCIMVDDALCAKGCKPGKYFLGGNELEVAQNGSCYLVGKNTLAGGTYKLNDGLQNLIEKVLLPVDTAINMITLNPARYLGIDDHKGRICASYDADLVVLDKEFEVVQTYYGGKEAK